MNKKLKAVIIVLVSALVVISALSHFGPRAEKSIVSNKEKAVEKARQDSLAKVNGTALSIPFYWKIDGYARVDTPLRVIYFPRKSHYRKDENSVIKMVSLETGQVYIDSIPTIHYNNVNFDTGESGKVLVYPVGTKKEWFSIWQ